MPGQTANLMSACCGKKTCCNRSGEPMAQLGKIEPEVAKITPDLIKMEPTCKKIEIHAAEIKLHNKKHHRKNVCDTQCAKLDPDSCCAKKINCNKKNHKCCDKKPPEPVPVLAVSKSAEQKTCTSCGKGSECARLYPDSCCAKGTDCGKENMKCCENKTEPGNPILKKDGIQVFTQAIQANLPKLPGAFEPTCRITFENDRDVFYCGEPLKGTIHYDFGGPTLIAGVILKLVVEGHVILKSHFRKKEVKKLYLTRTVNLLGNTPAIQICPCGKHSFDFSIMIPGDLPSSFNYDDQRGYVKYTLKTKLIRCCRSGEVDQVKEMEVFVVNPVDLNEQESFLRKSTEDTSVPMSMSENEFQVVLDKNINYGDVTITVTSPKTGYASGDLMPLQINVQNHTKKTIDRITVSLRMIATYMVEDDPNNQNNNKIFRDEKIKVIECEEFGPVPPNTNKIFDHEFIVPKVPPSKVDPKNISNEDDSHFVGLSYDVNVKCFTKNYLNRTKVMEASQPFRIGTVALKDTRVIKEREQKKEEEVEEVKVKPTKRVFVIPNYCDRQNNKHRSCPHAAKTGVPCPNYPYAAEYRKRRMVEEPLPKQMKKYLANHDIQLALTKHYGIHSKLFSNKRSKEVDEIEYFEATNNLILIKNVTSYPVFRMEHELVFTGDKPDLKASPSLDEVPNGSNDSAEVSNSSSSSSVESSESDDEPLEDLDTYIKKRKCGAQDVDKTGLELDFSTSDKKKEFCTCGEKNATGKTGKCPRLTARNLINSDDLLGIPICRRGLSYKDYKKQHNNRSSCCNRILRGVPVACDDKSKCVLGCNNST